MQAYKRFNQNIAIWLYPITVYIFTYTWVNHEVFSILGILMMLDIISGVAKTVIVGTKPTSRRFVIGIISKILVLIIPMILWITAKGVLWIELKGFVNIVLSMLVLAESYSVLQNIISVRQRKEIEEYDAMTAVLNFILKEVKRFIEESFKR